jgi:NADH-ubiquinone oxidoreductase chain 4
MINLFPGIIIWWFLLCVSNMAAPPSLNLLGEISLLISLVGWSTYLCILLAGVSFFSAAYSLYIYSLVRHGKVLYNFSGLEIRIREYVLVIIHWVPLNIIIIKGDLAILWLY